MSLVIKYECNYVKATDYEGNVYMFLSPYWNCISFKHVDLPLWQDDYVERLRIVMVECLDSISGRYEKQMSSEYWDSDAYLLYKKQA